MANGGPNVTERSFFAAFLLASTIRGIKTSGQKTTSASPIRPSNFKARDPIEVSNVIGENAKAVSERGCRNHEVVPVDQLSRPPEPRPNFRMQPGDMEVKAKHW